MKYLSSLILTIFVSTSLTTAYRARVVEYASYYETSEVDTMLKNIEIYGTKISAQDDIVVFPEYGLTGTRALTKEKVKASAILVPDPKDKVIPCKRSTDSNEEVLEALSCMAQARGVWVVVNVMEQDPSSKSKIYNTNIVFDRQGTIFAKYRKINLYEGENDLFTPGKDIVTFTTDFGVTFGVITCGDIIFKYPAFDILKGNVTDVIFPTAWYTTLPLSAALSVQQGYARRTGVNLLAANYYDPAKGNGGSGIYLANKDKEIGLGTSAGIEKVVPEIRNRRPDSACDEITPDSKPDLSPQRLANNYHVYNDFYNNTSAYNYKFLDSGVKMFSENLCTKDNKLCCKLDVQIFNALVQDGPKYTFFAFNRGKQYGCGVAYCADGDVKSCGQRNKHTDSVSFQKIVVTAEKFRSKSYDVPITADFNLLPTDSYKYCSDDGKITLEGNSQSSLLTFGIFINNNAVRAIGGISVAFLLCSLVALFNL